MYVHGRTAALAHIFDCSHVSAHSWLQLPSFVRGLALLNVPSGRLRFFPATFHFKYLLSLSSLKFSGVTAVLYFRRRQSRRAESRVLKRERTLIPFSSDCPRRRWTDGSMDRSDARASISFPIPALMDSSRCKRGTEQRPGGSKNS